MFINWKYVVSLEWTWTVNYKRPIHQSDIDGDNPENTAIHTTAKLHTQFVHVARKKLEIY